ncbi:MAG: HAD family phosphatase [Halioglobus sp.]
MAMHSGLILFLLIVPDEQPALAKSRLGVRQLRFNRARRDGELGSRRTLQEYRGELPCRVQVSMRYEYILFDHDGVLVDTEHWYFEATRRALAELDIELDRGTYQGIMIRGAAAWELAEQRGIGEATIAAQKARRDAWYQQYLVTEDIEIPGVTETLRKLQSRCRMAIVTTSRGADFDLIHRQRDIVPFMDFVLKREDYTHSKPDPEPYLLALEGFGAAASEALVVEDSERGLRSAVAAGIDCAIVHNAFTAAHDFDAAAYRIQSLAELTDLL